MFILDQSNPFEAKTNAFTTREAEIVQEHQTLFFYFVEVAEALSIVSNVTLEPALLQHLNVVKTTLMNGRVSYHFQLGDKEKQFVRTLPFKDLACYFTHNEQLIATFEEHATFFEPIALSCHTLQVDQKPHLYDIIEEKKGRFTHLHVQAATSPILLRHIAPRLFSYPITVDTMTNTWTVKDGVSLASLQHCTHTFTLSSPYTDTKIVCDQIDQQFTIITDIPLHVMQRHFSDCMLSYYEKMS